MRLTQDRNISRSLMKSSVAWLLMAAFMMPACALSQVFSISHPEKFSMRNDEFRILPKQDELLLIYRNQRKEHFVDAYDAVMKRRWSKRVPRLLWQRPVTRSRSPVLPSAANAFTVAVKCIRSVHQRSEEHTSELQSR